MIVSPPALLLMVVGALAIGILAGTQLVRFLFVTGVRYGSCRDLHKLVVKVLHEHWKHHPGCDITTMTEELCHDRKETAQPPEANSSSENSDASASSESPSPPIQTVQGWIMPQLMQDLIICQRCGHEHGPSAAKHVVRHICGHCGKSVDTENYQVPLLWAQLMHGNCIRYTLCPDCSVLHEQWLQGPTEVTSL